MESCKKDDPVTTPSVGMYSIVYSMNVTMYMYTVYCNGKCTCKHVHVVMCHDVVNDS